MGWCHEFGTEIEVGCGHPMVSGSTACSCAECGTSCKGRFQGGCEAVWSRAPRANAPGRPANYAAKAMFEPTVDGAALANGAAGPRGAAAHNGAVDVHDREVILARTPGADVNERLARLEGVITELADHLTRQSERQTAMERHLADLGRVLGHLGVETENRLDLLEGLFDDLTAPSVQQEASERHVLGEPSSALPKSEEAPVSLVVPLRPVSDDPGSRYEVVDGPEGYRARRS